MADAEPTIKVAKRGTQTRTAKGLRIEATVRTVKGLTVSIRELKGITRLGAGSMYCLTLAGFFLGQTLDWSRDWLNKNLMPVPVYLTATFGALFLVCTTTAIVLAVMRHMDIREIMKEAGIEPPSGWLSRIRRRRQAQ